MGKLVDLINVFPDLVIEDEHGGRAAATRETSR
jgi:hypothetical protein